MLDKQLDPRYRWFRITFRNKQRPEELLQFIYRGFTLAEERRAGSQATPFDTECFLLQQCVLDIDLQTAEYSVCRRLLEEIYHVSGWNQHAAPYKAALEWSWDETGMMEAVAVVMVQGLTFDILDHCDPLDRAKYMLVGQRMWQLMCHPLTPQQVFGKLEEKGGPAGQQPAQNNTVEALKRLAAQGEASVHQKLHGNEYQYDKNDGYGWDASQRRGQSQLPAELPPEMQKSPLLG